MADLTGIPKKSETGFVVEDVSSGGHPLEDSYTMISIPHTLSPSANNDESAPSTSSVVKQEKENPDSRSLTSSITTTKVITNGLQLKYHDQLAAITFGLLPRVATYVPIEWQRVVTEDLEDQHIRCHMLQFGDKLRTLMTSFKEANAIAVILINTSASLCIAPQYLEGIGEINLPVLVVTRNDGFELLKYLKKTKVFACVYCESKAEPAAILSDNTTKPSPLKEGSNSSVPSGSPSVDRTKSASIPKRDASANRTGKLVTIPGKLKAAFGFQDKHPTFNLKQELTRLMFTSDHKPVAICGDPAKFQFVMAAFSNFEKQVKTDSHFHVQVSEALKIIKQHLKEMVGEDFPFYILLIWRMYKNQSLYVCDDLETFIPSCLDKIEKLVSDEVADVFNNFMKRGDFMLQSIATDQRNESVFKFLEIACMEVSEINFKTNKKYSSFRFCYSRMMWISLTLKLKQELRCLTKKDANIWDDQLIVHNFRMVMNDDVLKDIVEGLRLGDNLKLYRNVSLNVQQMSDLFASNKCIHPFTQLRNYIEAVYSFLDPAEVKLPMLLTTIRFHYGENFQESGFSPSSMSKDATYVTIITEGIQFLEYISTLWGRYKFDRESIKTQCQEWLKIFIGLVDIRGDHAVGNLKLFLDGGGVVRTSNRTFILEQIKVVTRSKFDELSIYQFYSLFKAFSQFWTSKFLSDYLEKCTVPPHMKINDGTSTELFRMVVDKYPVAYLHGFLVDFLFKIAERYLADGHAGQFVLDLLELDVPSLFAAGDDDDVDDHNMRQNKAVKMKLTNSLLGYIKRNCLIKTILDSISERMETILREGDEFTLYILDIICQEFIAHSIAARQWNPNSVLKHCVAYLCKDLGWLQALSAKQAFCWGLVTPYCSRIHVVPDHFEWLHTYIYVITELSKIFITYCTTKEVSEDSSEDVSPCNEPDVERYFKWICSMRSVIKKWHETFNQQTLNYDDILLYASAHSRVEELCHSVCVPSLVVEFKRVESLKNDFLAQFELLNVYLLRYIPQHRDTKWCTFPALLNEYEVDLPQNLLSTIQKYVVFPDEEISTGNELLTNSLPSCTNGQFQPGAKISLRLSKQFSLQHLKTLVQGLDCFQQPLSDHLQMLIFFKLNHSVMFEKYFKSKCKRVLSEVAAEMSVEQPSAARGFAFSVHSVSRVLQPVGPTHNESLVRVLVKSSESTRKLLCDIRSGEAAYHDIKAEGDLDFEKLDIEKEFKTLKNYLRIENPSTLSFVGLDGFRNLFELFQYVKHIENIHNVCEQYQLEGCLQDKQLTELKELADKLGPEDVQSQLTTVQAIESMKCIRELLCINKDAESSHCWAIFQSVANSAEFFRFVKEKQFYEAEGQTIFLQQYQLITAQLQHEEYNESVLNHLLVAYSIIILFMNTKQTFKELMTKVNNLGTVVGLKQLETVNDNLTLIQLWFSRAEGDTLQNVAQQLDQILQTGRYTYVLHQESQFQMLLEYNPSSTLSRSSAKASKIEKLNTDQIDDFLRKLGFMDREKEGGEKMKNFKHLSVIAYKLLELYGQLMILGNSTYSKSPVDPLLCSISIEEADQRVEQTELTLKNWRIQVVTDYTQWLLFFSIPKMLCLYELLSCNEHELEFQVDQIVHEISFLCKRDELTRKNLRCNVQLKENFLKDINNDDPPMHVVGRFLALLFTNHKLPTRADHSLPRHRSLTSLSLSHDCTHLLHYCPGFNQCQLIQTVIGICSGVPEAYEVFHCRPSSTEGELSLFLNRAGEYGLRSLVLEVNKLPLELQESLIQFHMSIQQKLQIKSAEDYLTRISPVIHFLETHPSLLRDVPWIELREHKMPGVNFEKAQTICKSQVMLPADFDCIQLVSGAAGSGKTHYIKEQLLSCSTHTTIVINESFTLLKAISKLRALPHNEQKVAIFINFTILPPGDSVDGCECERYHHLMEVIGWFFFDLLILGYVEDPVTGKSFCIPGGLQWAIYIEVPSRNETSDQKALDMFCEEVPTLGLLCSKLCINPKALYTVDGEVQLVCKYLLALKTGGIDRLYNDVGRKRRLVKFSEEPNLSPEQCQKLLKEYMPVHIRNSKITQRLFVKYMKRRCQFLDTLPAFNYNQGRGVYDTNEQGRKIVTNTKQLGSTLLNAMLKEVSDFCNPDIKENWSILPHQQLIYDYKDHGASFGLISLQPDKLEEKDKSDFEKIGVKIPSMGDLCKRAVLDRSLSQALNIQLNPENNRLTAIDDSAYVLTLDYTIKMLNIHERYECGVPVIIEGETGVGKTALIEMLSKLWNQSFLLEWKRQKDEVVELLIQEVKKTCSEKSYAENYLVYDQAVQSMSRGENIKEETMLQLCELPNGMNGTLHKIILTKLKFMRNNPVVTLLTLRDSDDKNEVSLEKMFAHADSEDMPEATAKLLLAVLSVQVKSTFHKINVHAAMSPDEIQVQFEPVFAQAMEFKKVYVKNNESPAGFMSGTASGSSQLSSQSAHLKEPTRMPFVTVFLDEVNTSSCVGLFKEIIVDRTFDGKPIPENVFIVAACNPHRGNSMAFIRADEVHEEEKWVRGSYYVHQLHPTLRFLLWDYGSLDEQQEKEFVTAKMEMMNEEMPSPEVLSLTGLIVGSQNKMRQFAYEQIFKNMTGPSRPEIERLSRISSRSCVSQRDIQRVFTFYQWFMNIYKKQKPHGDRLDYSRRAVLVALGIVYYIRLNNTYRTRYSEFLDRPESRSANEVNFTLAFEQELNWYIDKIQLPKGIARTQALKENIFATIVCTVTHTPLIIVGAPGSSKTLSFNQTIANLKGAESRVKLFRDTSVFHSLDPHHYQCSRRTTSNEIQTVFSRAINRQRSHSQFNLPITCVVFMDEAGLPEESHESLKVLHYHLDKQEVSFVAITNHLLDAAKTNRAISLFRPEVSNEDLQNLAKGCFCTNPEDPSPKLRGDLEKIVKFCKPYTNLMKSRTSFSQFFGLRDFIHFINYLRRKRDQSQVLHPQITMHALERNFNGTNIEEFRMICCKFLSGDLSIVKQRKTLDILRESLKDHPQDGQVLSENEVRYKLIIDPSEDESLVRLLFSSGILERDKTRIFVCSNFPGDGQLQKINTIAAIRHSAIKGHTVVMSQTDDIHESFYDLFNQRFRRIDDPKEGPRYYTNIAIGAYSRPSRVHSDFQCVVVVKESEVKNTPAPFLNRFEKYLISHTTLLETALECMPPHLSAIIRTAMDKVQDFIVLVSGADSLYGLCPDTLTSLVLTLLPPVDHVYEELGELNLVDDSAEIESFVLKEIILALREYSGLFIPKLYTVEEFKLDVDSVVDLVREDSRFNELVPGLTHHAAAKAIPEAINVLNSDLVSGGQFDISLEGCFIIALIQQWLVRHLCKQIMQLMTSEALILHRNKIPFSYINHYLNFHTHFSLQKLVLKYCTVAKTTTMETPTSLSATKILCFTRSSPLIHQLPAEFPLSSLGSQMGTGSQKVLEDCGFMETDKLMIYKLTRILSQTRFQDLLNSFLESETAEVCLLVVNMQDTSKEIVNHVRIMIEETETLVAKRMTKIFVVLLHFPPVQFFQPCYPSLFLQGWDHCYLDTIAHSAIKGVVDIRDWFWQCCFPQQSSQLVEDEDALLQALQEMLPQVIPILASRVFFGSRQNCSFNSPMNGLQRSEALGELLFKKGKEGDTVGKVLCERFRTYWKPPLMTEHLQRAAVFSRNRESTLNITESIQTYFKSLFFDFIVYMVSQVNECFNIDIIFNLDCTPALEELFLVILRVFPTPKFSQINLLSIHLPQPKPLVYIPRFPFFQLVCEMLDKVVEESREDDNAAVLDIVTDGYSVPEPCSVSPEDTHRVLQQAVKKKIKDKSKTLSLVVEAMSKDNDLWVRYFNDFVLHKLRLDSEEPSSGIAQKIVHTYLQQLQQFESLERIVYLHTYFSVYQLNLAKIAHTLRPLNKLQKLNQVETESFLATSVSPLDYLLTKVEQNQHPLSSPRHLATFVITTLFHALVGYLYPTESSLPNTAANVIIWFKVFRDVMTLPNLKQYIYSALDDKSPEMMCVEARLNLMQATFLILQTSPVLDDGNIVLTNAYQVFQTLLNRYFDENLELKTGCPRLAHITEVAVEVTSGSPLDSNEDLRLIIEGLFAHFFSPERQHGHTDDIHWFLEMANKLTEWVAYPVVAGTFLEVARDIHVPQAAVNISVFKLYLGRILGQCDNHTATTVAIKSDPLHLYRNSTRTEIGTILSASPDLGPPGPFIPKFYRDCSSISIKSFSENARMQQPLAHLYFLTVLEHLMSKTYKLPDLVRLATEISELFSFSDTSNDNKVVLQIEMQAILQLIAQQLAFHLNPFEPDKITDVFRMIEYINVLMDDVSTGGGKEGSHGLVVALHLYKVLKSSHRFTDLIVKKYDSVFRGINCLGPFYEQLIEKSSKTCATKFHLFPFMMPQANSELAKLYKQVLGVMNSIHSHFEPKKVGQLKTIAEKCGSVSKSTLVGRNNPFTMMVWLVTYYEFFAKEISSDMLCNIIGGQEMSPYLKEEGYIRLIQCFLCPDLMINKPEDHTLFGRHQPISTTRSRISDPVHNLFVTVTPKQQDQSDTDLCHSLANMVAMVLGCPARSNHLWYHLFAPDKLANTYMTGFMYNTKISPEGLLYDCGVELTAEGELGRQDYNEHAGRGTYTLHSLYLLLWSNFGAFCMALLTQPDADTKIHGPIISDWQSIRHYCVSQLKSVWQHMRNNLGLSEEERIFLATKCMEAFQKMFDGTNKSGLPHRLVQTGSIIKYPLRGLLKTREELDSYEKMWHCCVYQPTWNELKDKFAEYTSVWQVNKVFENIRSLDRCYPQFSSEADFIHCILSYGDLEQHSEGGTLRGLSQFAQGWRRLQAGGLLLPDLVEFYQWLHTQLAYVVTYKEAAALPISKVVKRVSEKTGDHIVNLYERVKKGCNDYVDLIGGAIGAKACTQGSRVYPIVDDTPLLYFVTYVGDSEEEHAEDRLYKMIADIASAHNGVIETFYTVAHAHNKARYLPEEASQVVLTEIDDHNCLIGNFTWLHKVSNLLQVIRSRSQSPALFSDNVSQGRRLSSWTPKPNFQLHQLEEDILRIYVAGKPLIDSPLSIRIVFKFKQSQKPTDAVLEKISASLPDEFKEPLTSNLQKVLTYEFQTASYNKLVEVITALRIVCDNLVKVILEKPHLNDDREGLETLNLSSFMSTYVYKDVTDPRDVLVKIGMTPRKHDSKSDSQLVCLTKLPLRCIFNCLQQFVKWVDEGVYDFCNLPIALKTHMTERDTVFIEQELENQWTGSHSALVKEVKHLIDILKYSERDILKKVNEGASQKPVIGYFEEYHMVGEDDKLSPFIPETIVLQHYVHFRLALRSLNLRLDSTIEKECDGDAQANQWLEFVNDLWNVHLPHLREKTYGDGPATGLYGFLEDSDYESVDQLSLDLLNDYEDRDANAEEADFHAGAEEDTLVVISGSVDQQASASIIDEQVEHRVSLRLEQEKKKMRSEFHRNQEDKKMLASRARAYTPVLVGYFLTSIKAVKYGFFDEDVSGDILLDADVELLIELGVSTALDRVRIMTLFRRRLKEAELELPVAQVVKCLQDYKLEKYIKLFEEKEIDGDMLLDTEPELIKAVLKEIGVSTLHTVKILAKLKQYKDPTEVKVTARTSVVVTNSAQTFQWTDQGVNLHIPSDSLPTDVGRCVLQIFSSMSGNYQFPDNHELISTVIWVRCDPPCQFRKAITLELQHCAKKGSSEKLSFVRAVCSQKETDQPYSFGLKGHGSFTEKSSYGCIPLYHFSGIAVTTEAPNDRLYTASLYYLSRDIHRWDIHLVVTWDVEAHNTSVQQHYKETGAVKGAFLSAVEFEGEKIELKIPMDGMAVGDWRLMPLIEPVLKRKRVDYFGPGKAIPCCQLLAKFMHPDAPSTPELYHYISLNGARQPNMMAIAIDPSPVQRQVVPFSPPISPPYDQESEDSFVFLQPSATSTAFVQTLTLHNLSTELKDLTKPIEFGVSLNIEQCTLEIIKKDNHLDTNGQKIALFGYIAKNNQTLGISWAKIANALESIEYGNLALGIRGRYCHAAVYETVNVDQLISDTGINGELLSQQCTDRSLFQVASSLPRPLEYATSLKLAESETKDIHNNPEYDWKLKAYKVLHKWCQTTGHPTTYRSLIEVCLEIGDVALARQICKDLSHCVQ